VQDHRIDRLAALQRRSYNPVQPSEGAQQLGAVGAIGFLGLIGWGLVRLVRRDPVGADPAVAPLAFGTLVAVLCATIGGFSLLFALAGLTEMRSWNRISVMIAFFSFAFVALLIERGTAWLSARHPAVMRGGIVLGIVLPVLLVGALIDETTSAALPNYEASKVAFVRDRAFVRSVEASLPKGAAVFQLPYIPFPETPPRFGMADYDHVRGYLHSRDLNWSYGEVKGRHGDWQDGAAALPAGQMIPALIGAGFSAIWLDTAGYEDHGAALTAALASRLGSPLETSRYRVFDLRSVRGRVADAQRVKAAGEAVIHPVEAAYPSSWAPPEFPDGHVLRRSPASASVLLNNTLGRARSVTVSLLAQGTGGPVRLSIRHPGGVATIDLATTLQPLTLRFTLPAGGGGLRFEATSPIAVADLRVADDAIAAASIAAT
jgi:phosphoglycerol transferase